MHAPPLLTVAIPAFSEGARLPGLASTWRIRSIAFRKRWSTADSVNLSVRAISRAGTPASFAVNTAQSSSEQ